MADVVNSRLYKANKGIPKVKDAFIVIVKTEWNAEIVDALENGCCKLLHQKGIKTKTIIVPGAVEIPFAVQHYWRTTKKRKRPHAFIALGCVIKGDTPHFDYVCQSVTNGVTHLNVLLPVPVVFGVLTVNNQDQALERIGGHHGHKGEEAALTAIKMFTLKYQVQKG